MSADRQRIERSIRALALTAEERRALLGESKNKGGQPSSAGVGTSEAEEARICCDGSTSNNANPGTEERDPTDGDQAGLDTDDPADLGELDGGCLNGVTDCDTGVPICFCGDDFIPPDGWEDPNEPPLDSSYEDGTYWVVYNFNNSPQSGTQAATAEGSVEKQDALITTSGFSLGSRVSEDVYDVCIDNSYQGNIDCDNEWRVQRAACNGSAADYCNPDPEDIIDDAWPEDGCTNLAIIGGKIVGSKYDPDQDGSYSAPRDFIDLCGGNGNQITLRPSGSSSGGYKTIDAINGGDGYLYRNGKQIARVSGDEFTDPNV